MARSPKIKSPSLRVLASALLIPMTLSAAETPKARPGATPVPVPLDSAHDLAKTPEGKARNGVRFKDAFYTVSEQPHYFQEGFITSRDQVAVPLTQGINRAVPGKAICSAQIGKNREATEAKTKAPATPQKKPVAKPAKPVSIRPAAGDRFDLAVEPLADETYNVEATATEPAFSITGRTFRVTLTANQKPAIEIGCIFPDLAKDAPLTGDALNRVFPNLFNYESTPPYDMGVKFHETVIERIPYKFISKVEVVKVSVRSTHPIDQLRVTNFEVRENGVTKPILSFRPEPLTAAARYKMLVEVSASNHASQPTVHHNLGVFVDSLPAGAPISLSIFSGKTHPAMGFTTNRTELKSVIPTIHDQRDKVDYGSLISANLFSALNARVPNPIGRKEVMVLVTDGVEHYWVDRRTGARKGLPPKTYEELRAAALASGTRLIVLLLPSDKALNRYDTDRSGDLASLARDTGGTMVRVQSWDTLPKAITEAAQFLHRSYTLQYQREVPEKGRPAPSRVLYVNAGKPGSLSLEVKGKNNYAGLRLQHVPGQKLNQGSIASLVKRLEEMNAGKGAIASDPCQK